MAAAARFLDPRTVLPEGHPLWQLDGAVLGPYRLRLEGARQLPASGWREFRAALSGPDGAARPAVLEGIHSVGGKGAAPWLDLEYRPVLTFGPGHGGERGGPGAAVVDLREGELEVELFRLLRRLVPANGHVMVAYETPAHRETQVALMHGVPAAATPLGWALWRAGFDGGFRDWNIPEGGHEGPKKLQANVAVDATHARAVAAAAAAACRRFLRRAATRDPEGLPGFWEAARRRAAQVAEAGEDGG